MITSNSIKVPATYMRGGTSKGIFFRKDHLPKWAQQPGEARDRFLLRVVGSPDPYGKQIDGMGGASSSTSKVVIVSQSVSPEHDIDYQFGQVAIDKALVDWSGNCGNLTAAVGGFAIDQGMLDSARLPQNGAAEVRLWQKNINKTIIAHIPMSNGAVQEYGDFYLDGVSFPAAPIRLEFIDPAAANDLFPSGNVVDQFRVPGVGEMRATFINAGIPTIFVDAAALGFRGTELQTDINGQPALLQKLENIRAHGALAMGIIEKLEQAASRQHTPKLAWVAPAQGFTTANGERLQSKQINLCVRAMSMGKLHHAMMGTAAVAIAAAAAVPGTLVNLAAGGGLRESVVFGHPSGRLTVGAEVVELGGQWRVNKVVMQRSARILMTGQVHLPPIAH